MSGRHVFPINDLIVHDTDHGDDCVCGPTVEPIENAHGTISWLYIHHSLDGRELTEPPCQR